MYSLRFTAHSEVGRVRKNNQDAGYASPTMLLVADGMGGAAAGDLASAVAATEAARSDHRADTGEEMLERIAGMIARANAKLTDLIDEDLELDGMGTTFCGAMFNGDQFGLAHVGDSRGYLLRDGELTQLTHDHSWVQSLIDEGKITVEQAATHPHRSLILKVLNGQVHFEPDLEVLDAQLGDRLMLCSDGLSGLMGDDELHALLAVEDPAEAIAQLAERANRNGGHDNITIVVGDVVEQDPELDALPGVLVGSATEVTIPRAGQPHADKPGREKEPPYPAHEAPVVVEHDASEVARYAPREEKRRWPGVIASVLFVALVLGAGAWGLVAYSNSRFFVGADEAYVAIFNGLPGTFLGLEFNERIESSDVAVADLPFFHQDMIAASIGVPDVAAGRATVVQLRAIAERCSEVRLERRQERESPSPALVSRTPTPSFGLPFDPTYSPTPTTTPIPTEDILPSALGTVTPSDPAEADPEDC